MFSTQKRDSEKILLVIVLYELIYYNGMHLLYECT